MQKKAAFNYSFYIFSAYSRYYKVALKVDVKETVEFEDNTFNDKSGFNGLIDKTFRFAGKISRGWISKEYEIKFLDFKFVDVDEDIAFANIQCLQSKV